MGWAVYFRNPQCAECHTCPNTHCSLTHAETHICVCSITKSRLTLQPHGMQPARILSVHGIFQARILTGVLPFPPPRDLPNPGIKLVFPAWHAYSLPLSHQGSPRDAQLSPNSCSLRPNNQYSKAMACDVLATKNIQSHRSVELEVI